MTAIFKYVISKKNIAIYNPEVQLKAITYVIIKH